jgi:hypothetical protein
MPLARHPPNAYSGFFRGGVLRAAAFFAAAAAADVSSPGWLLGAGAVEVSSADADG